MKFIEGMFIGSILATSATLMYSNKNTPKKMLKKGKNLMKKINII